ncbi:MAG: hypothetical protein ACTSYI_02835 [Promethearchaeota archaeon]
MHLLFNPSDVATRLDQAGLTQAQFDTFSIEIDGVLYWRDPADPTQALKGLQYYDIAFFDRLMELATGNYILAYDYHEFLMHDDNGNIVYDISGSPIINPAIKEIIQFMPHLFDRPLSTI